MIKPLNHPYAEVLQETLKTQKKMLECLEKRLVLITESYATKSEYEKNEIEITRIKTESEIDVLKRIIREKENYFIKYMQSLMIDIDDVDKNYENVLKTAKAKQKNNEGIDKLLKSVKWDAVNDNIQIKVDFYKRLKELVK